MKRASVHLHDYKAGTLTEDENGYTFCMIKIFRICSCRSHQSDYATNR